MVNFASPLPGYHDMTKCPRNRYDYDKRDWCPRITRLKCFARVTTQRLNSLLIDARRIGGGADLLLKINVVLPPSRPRNDHGERSHHFAVTLHQLGPLRLGGKIRRPLTRCWNKSQANLWQRPKALWWTAMGEKVSCRLSSLLAKRVKSTIVSPSRLNDRLSKVYCGWLAKQTLNLRWRPSLPHQLVHVYNRAWLRRIGHYKPR
jgi:hypothetical protein